MERQREVTPGQLFTNKRSCDRRRPCANTTVRLRNRALHQAEFPGLLGHRGGEHPALIRLVSKRAELFTSKFRNRVANQLLFVVGLKTKHTSRLLVIPIPVPPLA